MVCGVLVGFLGLGKVVSCFLYPNNVAVVKLFEYGGKSGDSVAFLIGVIDGSGVVRSELEQARLVRFCWLALL